MYYVITTTMMLTRMMDCSIPRVEILKATRAYGARESLSDLVAATMCSGHVTLQ